MLISEEYRQLNAQLHKQSDVYGKTGFKFAKHVARMCELFGTKDILDYGCGKGTLATALNGHYKMQLYDPAIEILSKPPVPADILVCTDVLEHIEPEYLDNVLKDMARLMKKAGLLTVACRPAKKTLPDGRNAHLIQEGYRWWLPKIWTYFHIREFYQSENNAELVMIVGTL